MESLEVFVDPEVKRIFPEETFHFGELNVTQSLLHGLTKQKSSRRYQVDGDKVHPLGV